MPDLRLPNHLHFNNLRHTFITELLRKGISIYKVKVLARHSFIKTTEGYAHLIVEDLRNAVNVFVINRVSNLIIL